MWRVAGLQSYIAAGKVSTLKHELRNHTVKFGARVSETLLAGAQSAKVLGRLWYILIVEVEIDAATLLCFIVSADSLHEKTIDCME